MPRFPWTQEEADALKTRDETLARFMELAGPVEREIMPDLFMALVHAIVGQQISSRVQARLWEKLVAKAGEVTPRSILALSEDDLREVGLSARKARYALGAARAFATGEYSQENLEGMDDKSFIEALTKLKGIGVWTAEMLLLFSLARKNVLSRGDFGIRKGLRMLYGLKEIDGKTLDDIEKRLSPHNSLASLYLWELASGRYEGYQDPAQGDRKPKAGARTKPTAARTARTAKTAKAARTAGTAKTSKKPAAGK